MSNKKNECPIVKNEHYNMTVNDLGINGEGIGKVEGFTVFVEGALPNEEIEVRIIKIKKNFAFGKLMKIISRSDHRVEPVCPIANRCGGCQLQHLSYEGQLQNKTKKVQDLIERIGGIKDVKVKDTLGMDEPYYYRNKVQFPVREKDGEIQIGFYAARSHQIINTTKCYIQPDINETIVAVVKEFMVKHGIKAYNEFKHSGVVRHILVRTAYHTGEVMVCLVINQNDLKHKEKLVESLRQIPGMASICLNINKQKTNVILGNKVNHLWGKETITDFIGAIKFEISPLSFFQVNPTQTEVLYNKALEFADLKGNEVVWDAYCGIGSISLFLAQQAKKVYGVEIVAPAIEDAKKNAKINDIDNVEFFVGGAEEIIPKHFKDTGIKPDVMVVDPPRKGCDEALLQTIVEMAPEKVVYVSCDPATLARDLKFLVGEGYEVVEVQPVDMFPQTTHVECCSLLVKKGNKVR